MNRPKRENKQIERFKPSAQAIPAIVVPQNRTLNLQLPKSQDIKFSNDWGEWNNPFWYNNFHTPNDNITKLYMHATDTLNDLLPANFRLIPKVKEAFGIANLELNSNLVKPIKRIPLLSKLENGDYELANSKSDKNIASSIKFFRNNLQNFICYKDTDDIGWVIKYHRLLVANILDYYASKGKPSLATSQRVDLML